MNWIISYPRSGNTATRYMVEFLTGKPTKDAMAKKIVSREQKSMIHEGDDYIAYKRHDFTGVQSGDRLIFILRNPKECLVRHNEGKRELNKEFFLKQVSNDDGSYCGLLKRFNDHAGDKMLIYYEDLITNPIFIAKQLSAFFDADESKFFEYIENSSKLTQESLKCYPKSQTKGIGIINHSKKLSKWIKISIDNLIKKHQPLLWDKYLNRYVEV